MTARVLGIDEVQIQPVGDQKVTVVIGRVEGREIFVGDDVTLVGSDGTSENAMIAGILPAQEGEKHFDVGKIGFRVKVILRRKNAAVTEILGGELLA